MVTPCRWCGLILAGMPANYRVESHFRDFVEKGFEVAVMRDATAGSKIPEGDAYLAALINYRRFANALWTTDVAIARLTNAAQRPESPRRKIGGWNERGQ